MFGLPNAIDRAATKIAHAIDIASTRIVAAITVGFAPLIAVEAELEETNKLLTRLIKGLHRPPMPGVLSIHVSSEGENNVLNFSITGLAKPTDKDVVKRELSVKVGDDDARVTEITDLEQIEVGGFSGPDNATVLVSLVDIDDADNRSQPREQQFTLQDTIAPSQPGEFGLRVDSET